jgi:SagB-type dehydrogenase family enzyme
MKIKKLWFLVFVVGIILVGLFGGKQFFAKSIRGPDEGIGAIELPSPKHKGQVSVEEAIFNRRSIRRYKDGPLTLEEVSQLLWAAGGKTVDGVTGATRAYPSAGGIYPLEIYLIAGDVEGLTSGIYHYQWRDHSVALMEALGQGMVARAPMSLVFTAVYKRTTARYGRRGEARYVPMDMGGAGQNVHLQAEALGLGTVIIGAFNDEEVKKVLGIQDEEPLYIMPVGRI